jgi:hypothetical protein
MLVNRSMFTIHTFTCFAYPIVLSSKYSLYNGPYQSGDSQAFTPTIQTRQKSGRCSSRHQCADRPGRGQSKHGTALVPALSTGARHGHTQEGCRTASHSEPKDPAPSLQTGPDPIRRGIVAEALPSNHRKEMAPQARAQVEEGARYPP